MLKFDQNYNNEQSKLYPNWRKSCTIPAHIIQKIRQVDIITKRGKITRDEAELFNCWIDVMYVASFPDIVSNVMDWFQGYVVFRVFGHGDFNSYSNVMNFMSISMNKFVEHEKYIWSPILYSLDNLEDPRITKNKLYLNAFVSNDRLGHKWSYQNSNPIISTTISYMDGKHPAKDVYSEFSAQFADLPYIVLGKNANQSSKITGYLDHDTFFASIARSRMFIYLGFSTYYHLHFSPLEAISMGVPVLFLEKSGLTREARDNCIDNHMLKQAGMCSSIKEMRERVIRSFHDPAHLEQLAKRQYELFSPIFSRNAALKRLTVFLNNVQGYIKEHRTQRLTESIYYNRPAALKRINNIKTDLPTAIGETVKFSLEAIRGLTGTLIYNEYGHFVCRRAAVNVNAPGMMIGQYIGAMKPGLYAFSIILKSAGSSSPAGTFSMGVWNPHYILYGYNTIGPIHAGEHLVTLKVNISPETALSTKELRFFWEGKTDIEISNLFVKRIT
ncbi:glycosyltransferase [Paenibacillus tarimensis]